MSDDRENTLLLKDDDLCELLQISRQTLWRRLKDGPREGEDDLRVIRNFRVAGERRWLRSSAYAFACGEPQEDDETEETNSGADAR